MAAASTYEAQAQNYFDQFVKVRNTFRLNAERFAETINKIVSTTGLDTNDRSTRLDFSEIVRDYVETKSSIIYHCQSLLDEFDPDLTEAELRIHYDSFVYGDIIRSYDEFKNHIIEIQNFYLLKTEDLFENSKSTYEYIISVVNTSPDLIGNIEDRIKDLNDYLKLHPDRELTLDLMSAFFPELRAQMVESFAPTKFTETQRSLLPTEAPETYQGLRGPETPPEFVQRVYGEWLGRGLTRAHIRKLDPTLSVAINNWVSRPGNEWPADVDLPTKAEQNTRDLETLRSAASEGSIGRVLGDFTAKEAGRLRSALQRREYNSKQ